MIIKNARVFTEDNCFVYGDVSVEAGRFKEVPRTADNCKDDGNKCTWGKATEEGSVKNTYKGNSDGKILDASGLIMIPGLVDIHFHGCRGADMCDGTVEALDVITSYEASVGVTSVCPATMTIPRDELLCVMKNAGDYTYHGGAHLVGINMEGPFISPSKKGAQAAENIMHCDYEYFRQLQDAANGLIKLVDIKEAIEHGASHATHLYNAMPSLHHRNPGVIGAVRDSQKCHVELICDGVHIHPSVIRATFAMFGAERIILISDSMRATGLENGEYTLGGQPVTVRGNLATLHDGTIAGSATNLMDCMRFAINEAGISLEEAIMCATANPAKEINIFDEAGSISVGKKADFVLLNNALDIVSVYIDGKEITC